jgi:hypothetical protein
MAEAIIGWSTTEVCQLISLCNAFNKSYSDAGQGASRHLWALGMRVEDLLAVLHQLGSEADSHSTKIYISYTSIENTLKDCKKFFEQHPVYLKIPSDRSNWEKLLLTVEYVHSTKEELENLCHRVESHYLAIYAYLTLLNTYVFL